MIRRAFSQFQGGAAAAAAARIRLESIRELTLPVIVPPYAPARPATPSALMNGKQAVAEAFAKAAAQKRPAYIPYVPAAYPDADSTVALLLAMQRGGADIIELGMPFSDPIADGPTIQKACFKALTNGVTTDSCLEYVKQARQQGLHVPVILMTYYNIFLAYGERKMAKKCAEIGVHGFIVVDLPLEEASLFAGACDEFDLCFVPLVAPTSEDERLKTIASSTSGYVYCVSVTGTTGSRKELPTDLPDFLSRIRNFFGPGVPRSVGFGLSTPAHVKQVGALAEGAVIGSKVVSVLEPYAGNVQAQVDALEKFTKEIVEGSKQ